MAKFLRILGTTLTIIFSLGAVIGAMITMYAAVASRVTEIGTLRALGFRRGSILAAFMAESLFLGLLGGLLGLFLASFMQLITISTMNWQTFSELAFGFDLTPRIAGEALLFSLVMGFLGRAAAGRPGRTHEYRRGLAGRLRQSVGGALWEGGCGRLPQESARTSMALSLNVLPAPRSVSRWEVRALTVRSPGANSAHQTPSATAMPAGTFSVAWRRKGTSPSRLKATIRAPSASCRARASSGWSNRRIPRCRARSSSCS